MHTWAFRARFRRAAFNWKGSRLAIERIHDALGNATYAAVQELVPVIRNAPV